MKIAEKNTTPVPQKGAPNLFKRCTPANSNIATLAQIEQIYDYIRMLDAEGCPKAFMKKEHFRFEFNRASFKANGSIISDVRIIQKK
ncbi:hypothetical protein [Microscilla marina]|nr:hypothetical protein [Microscilla marina]